ncbi:MAG: hypothetical protein JHC93_06235 [Parachlamydiales bacterium]|nr:hypothetical protein [Parachlamydiales bacterium]
MAHATSRKETHAHHGAIYQAYQMLHIVFILLPIAMGLDKFFNIIVNWNQYFPPFLMNSMGENSQIFWTVVGIIEVIIGMGVWFKPKVFAYIFALMQIGIIINLITFGVFYEIVLTDTALLIASLALGRLSSVYDRT